MQQVGQEQAMCGRGPEQRAGRSRLRRSLGQSTALAVLFCLAAGATLGQQGGQQAPDAGGVTLTFGLQSELRADDNFDLSFGETDGASFFDNTLSFGLQSETDSDLLRLDVSGILRVADLPLTGTEAGLEDPTLRFSYTRDGPDSRLELDANYRDTDLAFLDPLSLVDLETGDLIRDTGTRLAYGAGLSYEMGIEAPFGATVTARRDVREYTDTTDPGLFDTTTDRFGVALRFRVSPSGDARLFLDNEHYTAENPEQTDRTTRSLSLGLDQALSSTLTLAARLGYSEIDTDEIGCDTRETGVIGSFGLVRDMPVGTAGVEFDQTFGVNGERSTLRFSRDMELPAAKLRASLGATKGEAGGAEAVASLGYEQELPRGALGATLERTVGTDSLDEDVLTTRFALNYRTEINSFSAFALSLDYAASTGTGDSAATDRDAATFAATYTRALTEEVDLSAGYRHRLRKEEGDTARSNAVFLTLSRNVTLRP